MSHNGGAWRLLPETRQDTAPTEERGMATAPHKAVQPRVSVEGCLKRSFQCEGARLPSIRVRSHAASTKAKQG